MVAKYLDENMQKMLQNSKKVAKFSIIAPLFDLSPYREPRQPPKR
jgi:hypothetical protein